MGTLMIVLLLALAVGNVLDYLTTRAIIAAGGYEENPVMAWIMHKLGPNWYLAKLIPVVLIAAVSVAHGPAAWLCMVLFALDLGYYWVVWHNYSVLHGGGGGA